jgi:hypothetical protein
LGVWSRLNFFYQSAHGQVYSAKKLPGIKRLSATRILPYYRGKVEVIPFDIYSFRGDCNRLFPGDTLRIKVEFSGKGHKHHPLVCDTVLVWRGVKDVNIVKHDGRCFPGEFPIERVAIQLSDSGQQYHIEGQRAFAPLQFYADGNAAVSTPDKLIIPQSYYDSLWPWGMRYKNGQIVFAGTLAVKYSNTLRFNGRGQDGLSGSSGSDGSQGGSGETGGGGEGGGDEAARAFVRGNRSGLSGRDAEDD